MGRKHCEKRRNFSFFHCVFKRLLLQTLKNQSFFGKGLSNFQHSTMFSCNFYVLNFYSYASVMIFLQGGSCTLSSRDDAENYRILCAAMHVLNFDKHEEDTVHKMLAAVLHAGNIYFKRIQVRVSQGMVNHEHVRHNLTNFQTTIFRLFQTERVCRQQFQI